MVRASAVIAILAGLASCSPSMQEIHDQVAADALAQYEMVAKSGTPTDKCVQAGLVAQAYLQAKREAEYDKWKLWQKMDCAVAGVPI